jgi:hypothetical protein
MKNAVAQLPLMLVRVVAMLCMGLVAIILTGIILCSYAENVLLKWSYQPPKEKKQ